MRNIIRPTKTFRPRPHTLQGRTFVLLTCEIHSADKNDPDGYANLVKNCSAYEAEIAKVKAYCDACMYVGLWTNGMTIV